MRIEKFVKPILFILIVLNSYSSFGQVVKTIDEQKIIEHTQEYKELNKTCAQLNDSMFQKGQNMINDFNERYVQISKHIGCATPSQAEKALNELKLEQAFISNYDLFRIDTLPMFRSSLMDSIKSRVNHLVENYSKNNGINMVIDKSNLTYFDEKSDITDRIIEVYSYEIQQEEYLNKWEKNLADKKNEYGIPDKLRINFSMINKAD